MDPTVVLDIFLGWLLGILTVLGVIGVILVNGKTVEDDDDVPVLDDDWQSKE